MGRQREYGRRHEAEYRYGTEYRGRRRGGRGYGKDYGRYFTPFPGEAGYPAARWGWGPVGWVGWGPGMEYWPYASMPGYGSDGTLRGPRRPPRESPTYGRGGDRALGQWARRYGYDLGYEIRPRRD